MKTLIVGMGIVGVMHGWVLGTGGVDVTHKVRPGSAAKYAGGRDLDVLDRRGGGEERRYRAHYDPTLLEEVRPEDGFELVMVPTKAYQAAQAVAELKDCCPDAQFLVFTANWQGPGEIDALLPRERYLWGYSACSGGVDDGVVVANIADKVRLGEWGGADTPRLRRIVALFERGGFRPDLKADMIQWLWVHQGLNSAMIGTALMVGGLPAMAGDREHLRFMVRAVRESLEVVRARGVDPAPDPDAAPFLSEPADQVAETYHAMLTGTEWGRRTVRAGHFNQNRREMQHFFCEVYRTAKEQGRDTPLLDEIDRGIGGCRQPQGAAA